jgi:hypothetical protein
LNALDDGGLALDPALRGREFYPVFSVGDLTNLSNHAIYLRLMIDGMVSPPFSAETITAAELGDLNAPEAEARNKECQSDQGLRH